MKWTLAEMPDLTGRVALVTGGNAGLGFKTSLELARCGARVFIACRSTSKGARACEAIWKVHPSAEVTPIQLDLLDLESVAACAATLRSHTDRLDLLINNAGVVNLPELRHTPDGHEMHMATNHFGHFALTGHLYALLVATPDARVVTLSSGGHRWGTIDFDDLDWRQRPYHRIKAYGDSKLANLYFMRSLQARFEAAGATALSVAAHPGLTGTERQQSEGVGGLLSKLLASPVEKGVRPQLFAATDARVRGGDFFGPRWGMRGGPHPVELSLDDTIGDALWAHSEAATGVHYPAH